MRTSYPLASNWSTVCDPMKPAPPVTSTLIAASYPRPPYDSMHGLGEDFEVKSERPGIDVFEVEARPVLEILDRVSAFHLPEASHPGHHTQLSHLPQLETTVFITENRSRPNQAHLAPNDIHKLGKLIKAVPSEPAPDGGDARIIGQLEDRTDHLVLS